MKASYAGFSDACNPNSIYISEPYEIKVHLRSSFLEVKDKDQNLHVHFENCSTLVSPILSQYALRVNHIVHSCLVSHCCWSRCVVRLGLASSGSTVWNLYDLAGRFVWVLAVTISHPDYNQAQNRSRVVQGGQSEAALSRSFAIKLRRVILADSMLRRVLDLTYFNRILVYT